MTTTLEPTAQVTASEREILRRLGGELAQIAALPVHRQKADLWRRLNQLEPVRPMVLMTEVPWHELNVDDELTLRCQSSWAQGMEGWLRRELYQWRHMPGDMVVSNYFGCPIVWHSTGFGITEDVDVVRTDLQSSVVSRHFKLQITEPKDLEKIKRPVVTRDDAATAANFQLMTEIFAGLMPVRVEGLKMIWFTPWDNLIRWWGVQEALMDLVMRPEMVHEAVERMVEAHMAELDQMEQLNLLTLGNENGRTGSGGYGFTDDLPGQPYDPAHVRPNNLWGCSNAQIFSSVSPEMHWDFAVAHDLRWLKRWGLTYYGCCEPLDTKMEILRRIPNLRKVSMSPWIEPARAAAAVGADYVFSYKPNPALVAEDGWHPDMVRQNLRDILAKTQGCRRELILKDISTVRYDPRRLWDWARITVEEAERAGA